MAADELAPDIRDFTAQVAAAYARFPSLDSVSLDEARNIIEQVRAPWRQGGPVMHRVAEHNVACAHGTFRVRIYDPTPSAPKPALLYAHGGGWTFFSLDTHDRVMREYAARAGIVVVGIDYALAPEAKFPVAIEQMAAAVRWAHDHGAAHGIDGTRLVLGGDSAGGNLSMGAAVKLRDEAATHLLRGLLLNYPALRMECSDQAEERHGGPGAILNRDEVEFFWKRYLRTAEDARNPLAAPWYADLSNLPPTLFTVAACDVLAEQSIEMVPRLQAAGIDARAEIYPGATHSFLEAVAISPTAGRALQTGADWLRRILGAP